MNFGTLWPWSAFIGGLDHLFADRDRVLGDRSRLDPTVDGVELSLAGVKTDDLDALLTTLLDTLDGTDGRALVGAEDTG